MRKDLGQIKILIIEDEQEKREELVELLRDLGFSLPNIFYTQYAETGIEILDDELPDVVLLDLNIPYSKDNISVKIDNSNKVINAVERLNALRNQDDDSTGILIISASVDDEGIRKKYKHTPEVVDFFVKEDLDLKPEKFKDDLKKKIIIAIEREFNRSTIVEIKELRNLKLKKLQLINVDLFRRIEKEVIDEFEKLNNRKVNESLIARGIIGTVGIIVEDVINLLEDKNALLQPIDDSDNFYSVRNRLNKLTGREWIREDNKFDLAGSKPMISRKAADYARYAYQLRSEVLHTKEGDTDNKKIFNTNNFTIFDASISISLITPLIHEFIDLMEKK